MQKRKIADIIETLDLKLISGAGGLQNEITGCYVSDLLSDVIGNAREGELWITLQTHQNIIAVASLKDLAAIILVRGLTAEEGTIEKSNLENIPVLTTTLDTFSVAGILYQLIKKK